MATTTHTKPKIAEIPTDIPIDPITLDIIEGALKSARYEMDAVLFRSAMSPVIREQHDEFPMITDPRGRMVVGNEPEPGIGLGAAFPNKQRFRRNVRNLSPIQSWRTGPRSSGPLSESVREPFRSALR